MFGEGGGGGGGEPSLAGQTLYLILRLARRKRSGPTRITDSFLLMSAKQHSHPVAVA